MHIRASGNYRVRGGTLASCPERGRQKVARGSRGGTTAEDLALHVHVSGEHRRAPQEPGVVTCICWCAAVTHRAGALTVFNRFFFASSLFVQQETRYRGTAGRGAPRYAENRSRERGHLREVCARGVPSWKRHFFEWAASCAPPAVTSGVIARRCGGRSGPNGFDGNPGGMRAYRARFGA